MINVLYIIDKMTLGGAQQHLLALAPRLDRSRFSPTVCCLMYAGELAEELSDAGVPVFALGMNRLYDHSGMKAFVKLISFIRRNRIDIVQTYLFSATIMGVAAGRLAGAKRLISCRRDLGYWSSSRHLWALKISNAFADVILTNSEAVRRSVIQQERADEQKVEVIYNGCEIPEEPGGKFSNRPLTVGMVANLREVKDHVTFIEAAKLLIPRFPKIKFLIIGDGPLRSALETAARPLSGHLEFTGKLLNPRAAYAPLDISVLCSTSEGFSNAVIESMAWGLPVVATDVGGNPEAVAHGETGFLVPPKNPRALADAMAYLLEDAPLRRKFGEAGRRRAQVQFSVETMVQRMEKLYDGL